MKKSIITMAFVLLGIAAQSQTTFKVHNNGQISLQSTSTIYGIQIPSNGVMSIEPNLTTAYATTSQSKLRHILAKAWTVKTEGLSVPVPNSFYVLGNGNVFAYGNYLTYSPPSVNKAKGLQPIEDASMLVSAMKGYYMDTDEFLGVTLEELENCGNVTPEALEGLLHDMEKGRTAGMVAEELENVLPEAVRHDPEGQTAINYNAVVTVLIEAFKEQQREIEELRRMLEENGLMKKQR